jgi:hypothetical protein
VITGTHANVDAGGWLIFRMPPAELGVHPAGAPEAPQATAAGRHELCLMCDDITATVDELAAKGVEFLSGVSDEGFGLMTTMRTPGGGVLGLYQARHPVAHDLPG